MAEKGQDKFSVDVKLMLANQDKFKPDGKIDRAQKIGAIEANFNNETGNIAFRADFPNPNRLLRHGQTGTVSIDQVVHDAIQIPQRASFENLAKRYVYIVDKDNVVHQREIVVEHELDDIFVIKKGILDVNDKIILEGIRQVSEGEKVKFELITPQEAMNNLKKHAE
jgi:membrane fusion protein (multidrug efflux system)